ncbi:MAG: hypothetical protein CM1200mP17_15220 [Woeseia sp.]|nr:MAG: hypothetical protein CM1200mP17_15220 [Woeseia sp.]
MILIIRGLTIFLRKGELIADDSVSLHEFTRTLHETLEPEAKEEIIEMLWRLAMSDDDLDKHEDYLVRKVAGSTLCF